MFIHYWGVGMNRTQIYLDEQLSEALKRQSKIQKKKVSQIIREILRESLLSNNKKAESISDIAGIWSDRDFDTDEYIRNLRTSKRFERLYNE